MLLVALLTKDQGAFIGPITKILGYVMNGIFSFLDMIGWANTGLAIILFTIVIYLALLPLTIKQQKFSKLSAKMNPELQVIRDKYKGKKDQASMQAMQVETQAVYARYGVSQAGTCVQLLIQMPILLALYRVINNMPAYVGKIKEAFSPLVDNLIASGGSREFFQLSEALEGTRRFIFGPNLKGGESSEFMTAAIDSELVRNTFIDVINRASPSEMAAVVAQYPDLADDVDKTMALLDSYNSFLGINIGNSPSYMVTAAWNGGADIAWLALIAAFVIPVMSAATQWLNIKLMPQAAQMQTTDGQPNQMGQTMKTMNTMMPLMSAFFCFTLPAGMGLYWVAGAVIRSIQQVIINRHFNKLDLDEMIKQNVEKRKKKMEKRGIDPNKVNTYANMSTRNVSNTANVPKTGIAEKAMAMRQKIDGESVKSGNSKDIASGNSKDVASGNSKNIAAGNSNSTKASPGGIAAKANMVRDYNERNRKGG